MCIRDRYYYYFKLYNITTLVAKCRIDSFRLRGTGSMCHMFLLNVAFSIMCVGFGFSNVTFRPSHVFHSRVFSYPSVDTDEQSTGSRPHFYQCCDKFFVLTMSLYAFIGPTSLLYKQLYITVHAVEIFHCTIRFINQIFIEVPYETLASDITFTKLSTKTLLLWRCRVSFEYQGLLQNTPASFLLLFVNVQAVL